MTIKDCLISRRELDSTIDPILKVVNVKELKIANDKNAIAPYLTATNCLYEPLPMETELLVNESSASREFIERKGSGTLLASVSYTKVGRKKKKQIKKQLKKQFGEQARGETFKSLLNKHFDEQFKEIAFGRQYNIKLLKGVKAILMYSDGSSIFNSRKEKNW